MPYKKLRRTPRVSTTIGACVIDTDGCEIPVVVTDLSCNGFRMRVEQPMCPGERISLRAENGIDYPAQIEWASRHEAGGSFLSRVQFCNDVPQ